MIRNATIADIPRLLAMGERFYNSSMYSQIGKYSDETTEAMLRHLIDDDSGVLVVLDIDGVKGAAGALLYPFYMTGQLTGQELFWWCESSGKGLALLNELERQAADAGAKSFTMVSLDSMAPDRLDRLYLKKGYTRSEHTYVKEL